MKFKDNINVIPKRSELSKIDNLIHFGRTHNIVICRSAHY